jgi:hypothetical protein
LKTLSETEGILKEVKQQEDELHFVLSLKGNADQKSEYLYSSDEGLHEIKALRELLPEIRITRIRNVSELEENE